MPITVGCSSILASGDGCRCTGGCRQDPRIARDPSWPPHSPAPAPDGLHGSRFFPFPQQRNWTDAVIVSTKIFPGSVVMLNYLHVSIFLMVAVSITTNMQCRGEETPLGLPLSRALRAKCSVLACFWTVRLGLFCFVFGLGLHASCITLKTK